MCHAQPAGQPQHCGVPACVVRTCVQAGGGGEWRGRMRRMRDVVRSDLAPLVERVGERVDRLAERLERQLGGEAGEAGGRAPGGGGPPGGGQGGAAKGT
jgi:hypothetical protein